MPCSCVGITYEAEKTSALDGLLGGDLVLDAQALRALEQIVVLQLADESRLGGVGAVAVVGFERGVHRQLVLDPQIDVHLAGRLGGLQDRRDFQIRGVIDLVELLLHFVEVGHEPSFSSCSVSRITAREW